MREQVRFFGKGAFGSCDKVVAIKRKSPCGVPKAGYLSDVLNLPFRDVVPQFELDNVGLGGFSGFVRGRTAVEAVRRGAELAEGALLTVAAEEDLQGWQEVVVDGEVSGRVRLHQRMRFRRD